METEDWSIPESEARSLLERTLDHLLQMEDKVSADPESSDRDKILALVRKHEAELVALFDEYYPV